MPTNMTFFKAWLSFFLLATLGGFGVGMLLGILLGVIMAAAGADPAQLQAMGGILGFIVAMPVSFICFRWAVVRFILPTVQSADPEATNAW